ncbi:MAG: SUMF1/EgtB/PvdO family nonheme iron enzyme [Myxococcales bacterium]|nr:SUMF1/EgtB/PvdO family nonheme iron enzyme [Myxococcales bacterium]
MDPQADHALDDPSAAMDPARDPASPLSAFLAVLRTRGVPIGIAQHIEAARLLSLLRPTCDVQSLARSLGALLGRDGKEARLVENLFLNEFAEAFHFADYGPELPAVRQAALRKLVERAEHTTPADDARRRRRAALRWIVPSAVVFVAVLAGLAVFLRRPAPSPPPTPSPQTQAPPTAPIPWTELLEPEATPPDLRSEPVVSDPRWLLLILLSLVGTLPFSALWLARSYGPRRRQARKEHARAFWSKAREQLDGPVTPQLRLPPVPPPLDRGDLDDMATLLGRSDERQPTRQIDGEGTARATIALGNTPKLVWRERKLARRLLILCDVCSDMRPWQHKTAALIDGLRRRGVPLSVRYFDGSADLLRADEDSAYEPLSLTLLQNAGAALLVLSTGRDARDPHRPGQLARWIREASERVPLRVWLNPLSPRRLWRPELRKARFPMRVLPMTPKGLTAAAYELALGSERRLHIPDARVQPAREASESDVQRLEELIALYPDAPLDVVEWLWRRFLPDVPDDVLALTLDEEDVRWNSVQWSDERLAAALNRLRMRDAGKEPPERIEEQARRELFRLLDDSAQTMVRDSVGQLRLRLLAALQQIYLHGPGDQEAALATLRSLLRGPIYSEVAEAIFLIGGPADMPQAGILPIALPTIDALRSEFPQLVQSGVEYVAEVSSDATLPKGGKPASVPWPRPMLRDIAPALGLPALALLGQWWLGGWGRPVLPEPAYRLTVQATDSEHVRLVVQATRSGLPTSGRLCQDATCRRSTERTWDAASGFVQSRTAERQEIHLRARLRGGKLLYSNAVAIPKRVPPAPPIEEPSMPPVEEPPEKPPEPVVAAAMQGSLRLRFIDAQDGRAVVGVRYSVIDAKGQKQSGQGVLQKSLPIGAAKITAQAAGYAPRTVTVTIKAGLEQEVQYPLTTQQAKPDPLPLIAASPPDMATPAPPPDLSSPVDQASPAPAVAFRLARWLTIPGGTFTMGSERHDDEKPPHPMTVAAFQLDDIEVTAGAYAECVASGACVAAETVGSCNAGKPDRVSHPINCVNYAQAESYCSWRGGRLPTEEEWEYAARGRDGREYPWGAAQPSPQLLNACGSECRYANKMFKGNDGWPETAPVGSYPEGQSPFGALDLAGNVGEWVDGWHCSRGYEPGIPTRASEHKSRCRANFRMIRGGSWDSFAPTGVRAAYRSGFSPNYRGYFVGFRCARTSAERIGPPDFFYSTRAREANP